MSQNKIIDFVSEKKRLRKRREPKLIDRIKRLTILLIYAKMVILVILGILWLSLK